MKPTAKKILIPLYTLFGLALIVQPLHSQTPEKLLELYRQGNYEFILDQTNRDHAAAEDLIFRALAFSKLPENDTRKKAVDDPLLHPLNILKEAKSELNTNRLQNQDFYIKEFKTLQNAIYEKARKWYDYNLINKAKKYFDAIHETFDNTKIIFVNHYGFDDTYFVNHLKNQIDIPDEFYDYYKKHYDLLDKHYYGVEQFKEWNNPIYRMANTAKDEDYLTQDEKMVFYFLNLVRMNPKLFLETFLKTRLHIRYHGDLNLQIPVYDSLAIDQYGNTLTFDEFFELPAHKLYNNDLDDNTIDRFVKKKVIKSTPQTTKYSYEINYSGFYKFLSNNKPELLNLRNLENYIQTPAGKEFILFKLYDKKFTIYQKSFEKETKDHYHQSLFVRLKEMKPMPLLFPNEELFSLAECWALEAGQRNLKGHDRVRCPYGYDAECCDYGNKNGLDVVLSLLIDRYVPDLGHRKTLLGSYSEMGVAIRPHKSSFKYNAVLDFFR